MEGPGGTFHNNEKYDKINTWTSSKPMPIDRHGLVAVSVDDKVYDCWRTRSWRITN